MKGLGFLVAWVVLSAPEDVWDAFPWSAPTQGVENLAYYSWVADHLEVVVAIIDDLVNWGSMMMISSLVWKIVRATTSIASISIAIGAVAVRAEEASVSTN